jgi:uncharacterized protein YigA (DUF484 family)
MTRYLEIKPGSISETIKRLSDDYQAVFKAELEKTGKGLAQMTDAEKKAFFNKIDKMHNAKNEQAKKIDELTAGQKKLPPALQKAIKAKEKKESVEVNEEDAYDGTPAEVKKLREKEKKAKEKADAEKAKSKKEEVEITETEGGSGGGIDALRAIKGKRLRLQGELDALNKDDPSYKEKAAAKKKEIEAQKEIMARKQKEVYGSYDPSREDALDLNEGDLEEVKIIEQFSSTIIAKAKEIAKKLSGNLTKAYDEIEKIAKGLSKEPEVQKELQLANEEVEISEGQFKDIDIRKGDLKIARDKRQALKDKYNAIMANQARGDEDSIQDQIRKLDMSIKKQEQDLIDKMKKLKDNEKTEAVDPEKVQKLNQKIASMTTKMGDLDRSNPENKTKEAIMKSDIATAKLRLQDLMQKSASAVKKAVNEASKAKQSFKSLKMSLKKEQDINNKKKTLTDKPITKIDVNPKIEG